MGQMQRVRKEDRSIVQYLLGTLPAEAAEEMELRSFTNEEFSEEIEIVEEAMIQDYLDDALEADDTVLFRQKYLAVPELLEKVEFARRARVAIRAQSHRSRWPRWISFASPAFAAVGLLCLAFSLAWLREAHRLRGGQSSPMRTAIRNGTPNTDLAVANSGILTTALQPGLAMGAQETSNHLTVSSDIGEVRLLLDLPGAKDSPSMLVEILLIEERHRKVVWSRDGVPCVPTMAGKTVVVSVDPKVFSTGDYIANVKASHGDAVVAYFAFDVLRR